jgi:hypothetical protein
MITVKQRGTLPHRYRYYFDDNGVLWIVKPDNGDEASFEAGFDEPYTQLMKVVWEAAAKVSLNQIIDEVGIDEVDELLLTEQYAKLLAESGPFDDRGDLLAIEVELAGRNEEQFFIIRNIIFDEVMAQSRYVESYQPRAYWVTWEGRTFRSDCTKDLLDRTARFVLAKELCDVL